MACHQYCIATVNTLSWRMMSILMMSLVDHTVLFCRLSWIPSIVCGYPWKVAIYSPSCPTNQKTCPSPSGRGMHGISKDLAVEKGIRMTCILVTWALHITEFKWTNTTGHIMVCCSKGKYRMLVWHSTITNQDFWIKAFLSISIFHLYDHLDNNDLHHLMFTQSEKRASSRFILRL